MRDPMIIKKKKKAMRDPKETSIVMYYRSI